jgi:phenylalanine-4-hydroxylase
MPLYNGCIVHASPPCPMTVPPATAVAPTAPPMRDDGTMAQPYSAYTAADHAVWRQLYARQRALLAGRACGAFLDGLARLRLPPDRVPDFADVNRQLRAATGWTLVAVPGLLPDTVFFEHLAERRFPVTWWMRRADQLDYLQEPDCFHDLFGHVPLLLDPVYADFIEHYGRLARDAAPEALAMLARLYWFTVEFGLILDRTPGAAPGKLAIFGAGIVSSQGESIYSLESPAPHRLAFDPARVVRSEYRIDTFQPLYFVLDSFDSLIDAVRHELPALLAASARLPTHAAGTLADGDRVLARGLQAA